ncbi:MAG: universal stress protein [bacterium]
MKIHNILLPTDFSRLSNLAVPHAVFLCERRDATLHIFHAVVHGGKLEGDESRLMELEEDILRDMEQIAKLRLGRMLTAHDFCDVPLVKAHGRCRAAAPGILEYAAQNDIDLIVMGSHGRRGGSRLILGGVADEVIRRATCPVLTVREHKNGQPLAAVERILVPIDFSKHSLRALSCAKHLAEIYTARLQLLHVVQQMVLPEFYTRHGAADLEFGSDITGAAKEELLRCFDEAAGPNVPVAAHVVAGRAELEIVQFAERKASDIVVIATHGLTGKGDFMIGGVAQKVTRRAPCPVLSIKPPRLD